MVVLELFSGYECISTAFRNRGHECFTIDWDERFPSNLHKDISQLQITDLPERFRHPDVIFCGTDCTTYSVAAISKHRRKNPITGNLDPISEKAKFADSMNRHVVDLIKQMNPKVQIWENPMGAFRKMDFVSDLILNTTTYCQYGFSYRKQTDFLSNIDLKLKPPCKNGSPCHDKAPRGATTGLQAIKDPALKSLYPPELCRHIVKICEDHIEKKRKRGMKHLGDITKINGAEVPIVDIVTGGSPCQDLSVAGKRAGLKHSDKGDEETTRSGLFMEQIRIFKEMRNECIRQLRVRGANVDIRSIRPRFLVWENVCGAFSSNKGEDFRCVLEEICRVADQTATIPGPKNGKWSTSGYIVGSGEYGVYSVCWRVHNAQFWGVPQRRKRISLVADFGSESACKILFEPESVSRDIESCGEKGEEAPGTVRRSTEMSSEDVKAYDIYNFAETGNVGRTLSTSSGGLNEHIPVITNEQKCLNPWDVQSKHIQTENGIAEPLYSGECRYGGGESYVMQKDDTKCFGISSYDSNAMKSSNPYSGIYEAETSRTLDNNGGSPACNQGGMAIVQNKIECYSIGNGQTNNNSYSDVANTLDTMHDQQAILCTSKSDDMRNCDGSQISPTLTANNASGTQRMSDKDNYNAVLVKKNINDMYCMSHGGFMINADDSDVAHTLQATDYKDAQVVAYGIDVYNQSVTGEVSKTLNSIRSDSDHVPCVYGFDRAAYNQGKNAKYDFAVEEELAQPLVARGPGGVLAQQSGPCAQEITRE